MHSCMYLAHSQIGDLAAKVRELEVQDVERQCDKHLKLVTRAIPLGFES